VGGQNSRVLCYVTSLTHMIVKKGSNKRAKNIWIKKGFVNE
jgi:hypothetical protein